VAKYQVVRGRKEKGGVLKAKETHKKGKGQRKRKGKRVSKVSYACTSLQSIEPIAFSFSKLAKMQSGMIRAFEIRQNHEKEMCSRTTTAVGRGKFSKRFRI
jgi:hypothetical protein